MQNLAIIAGRGLLPERLYQRYPEAEIVKLKGVGIDFFAESFEAQFEKLGQLFSHLHRQNVTRVVFAGAMSRPQLAWQKLDFKTLMLLPRIHSAIKTTEGASLAFVRELFEGEGFEVIGAHDLLPELIAGEGKLGGVQVPKDLAIALAIKAHAELSQSDQGQALVIAGDQCIAREDMRGTAFMLSSLSGQTHKGTSFLFKASKLGQDLAMDMATIGIETIEQVKSAGLDGIVLGSGVTQILDQDEVIAAANRAGIFVMGIEL